MSKNTFIQADEVVSKLLAKLDSTSVPALIKEALGEGQRLGLALAVQRLADGTRDLPILNFTGAKRDKKPKGTVQCPVPNCNKPGIRPQSNFCKHHVETLDVKKRETLRAKQIENRKKEREKAQETQIAAQRAETTQPVAA